MFRSLVLTLQSLSLFAALALLAPVRAEPQGDDPPIPLRAQGGLDDRFGGFGQGRQGGQGGAMDPRLEALRPIQLDYSVDGGTLVCTWKILGEMFEKIEVYVDDQYSGSYPGNIPGVNFGKLALGLHQLRFDGLFQGRILRFEASHQILPESPVPAIEITRWLAYAFQGSLEGGFLEIQWRNRHKETDPYVEYEFKVNNIFQGRRPAFRTNTTFSRVNPGEYIIEITAFTRNYAAPAATQRCVGRSVAAPINLDSAILDCNGGRMTAEITYQTPPGESYSKIAVWNLTPGDRCFPLERCFLGFTDPGAGRIRIDNLLLAPTLVEIAGTVALDGDPEPRIFSNLPQVPGEHALVVCKPGAECFQQQGLFRRGDAEPDGALQITDAVVILLYLFRGKSAGVCQDAMDFDDDGEVSITDPILLLHYLFAHGNPPPPPGPFACGLDSSPDRLGSCDAFACSPQ